MKIPLKQIWIARVVFQKLFDKEYSDVKLSYALSKIAKKVNAEMDEIDKARLELVKKYTEKDEKGNPKVKMEQEVDEKGTPRLLRQFIFKDLEKFNKEFNDFLETEIEIDVWKIPWRAVEEVKLTPNEFLAVSEFVEVEDEKSPKKKKEK